MAIKNILARGVGFAGGVIGWVVTRGYGAFGTSTPLLVSDTRLTPDAGSTRLVNNNGATTLTPD